MLAIPLRSHSDSHLSPTATDTSLCSRLPEIPAPTSAAADAMISIMPTPRPLTPKRPKLSLQTSTISTLPASKQSRTALGNLSSAVNSPITYRNTYDNAFESTPSTPVSAKPHSDEAFTQVRQAERPSPQTSHSSSSISTTSSGPNSPFANVAPYTIALGARSILRNSPLPRRHTTHISNRPAKRMFHPSKRVSFPETLVEMIPTPALSEPELSAEDVATDKAISTGASSGSDSQRTSEFDSVRSPWPGRRKRRNRDWISRPLEDDASPIQAKEHSLPSSLASPSGVPSGAMSLSIVSEREQLHDTTQREPEQREDAV
ncbi:MAG: hypothetical protein Q9209_002427 [Squamulea sp. 1 TL-2023]